MRSWKNTLLNAVTAGVTLMAVVVVWNHFRAAPARQPTFAKPTKVADWREYATVGPRIGSTSAPVTITVFEDYQCPFCRAFAADLDVMQKKWPQNIAVVYRQYPLSFHPFARKAASAALCAGAQHKYREYHDRLFANQDSLGQKKWEDIGREAGVPDLPALAACMDAPVVNLIIVRDSGDAKRLGVHGTPTFLINDLRFEGSLGRDSLEAYITRELKKSA